jgi:hypothetical protein
MQRDAPIFMTMAAPLDWQRVGSGRPKSKIRKIASRKLVEAEAASLPAVGFVQGVR